MKLWLKGENGGNEDKAEDACEYMDSEICVLCVVRGVLVYIDVVSDHTMYLTRALLCTLSSGSQTRVVFGP
jgi:hypothetical protein